MANAWIPVSESDDIRQGDVVKATGTEEPFFGVVLTADCDIAQRKTNNRMTVVRAVPVQEFIKKYWATWEIERIAEKQIRQIIPFLNKKITAENSNLLILCRDKLIEWVNRNSPEEIFGVFGLDIEKNIKEFQSLLVISIYSKFAFDISDTNGLDSLARINKILMRPDSEIKDRVREALLTSGGFQDYFVIPNLPGSQEDGIVVLMREIVTEPFNKFCKTEYESRIKDIEGSYVRVGRLTDRAKYAISQRIAFVFSRIGMDSEYESHCGTLAEIVSLESQS